MTLPAAILALVEMTPVEDLLLTVLRDKLEGVKVQSLIKDNQKFPVVLVRRDGDWGEWPGDERFLDAAQIAVHVFCEGLEADTDAALLSEAVRVVLRDAIDVVVPQKGYLKRVVMIASPHKRTDWATATGPVQYADLPTGVMRYESAYAIEIRKPVNKPYPTP